MALSVTRARVKERCGITDTSYDTIIDNLITDYVPVIEYAVRVEHMADITAGLQGTLNLGALELICGEFLCLLLREPGAYDELRVGDVMISPLAKPASDAYGLKRQGVARLNAYLKTGSVLSNVDGISSMSGSGGPTGDGGTE